MICIKLGCDEIYVTLNEYIFLLTVFYPEFGKEDLTYQTNHLKSVIKDKMALWLDNRATKKDCENALKKEIISTTVNNLLDKL